MSEEFEKIAARLGKVGAITRPASTGSIALAEQKLGLGFDAEYKEFLLRFGVIICGSNEIYGLGVPDDYYLNVVCAYETLCQDASYPLAAVPLIDDGDGHYYLYDTLEHDIVLWAMPNGGIVRRIRQKLGDFVLKYLFSE